MLEKALLVGLILPNQKYSSEYTLTELKNLCHACEIEPVEMVMQKSNNVNTATYVGSGKIEEIKLLVDTLDIEIVVFDDELSPSQLRNIEKALEVKIIDRSLLILDIFRKRAKTQEAILEVKLAQLRYMLPRLVGLNSSLSRQGGNSGSFSAKGPGEKKIELDRRKIVNEILILEQRLAQIKRNRQTQKERRKVSNTPIIALVGYTNSGKSTTMNTFLKENSKLQNKEVLSKDQLFATLDTSVRKIRLANKLEFMLIDTVGFVSKLPHHLINSFNSTLSDILDADLIIHVADVSSEYYQEHIEVTNQVLESLDAGGIPQLYLLNKADLLETQKPFYLGDNILFSNKTLFNLDEIYNYITQFSLKLSYERIEIKMPLNEAKLISYIEAFAVCNFKVYYDDFIYYDIHILKDQITKFIKFKC